MNADEVTEVLTRALARAGHKDADAMAVHQERGFARFADGCLSQHMALEEPRVHVRVMRERRVAEVSTSSLDEDSVVSALTRAETLASAMPVDEEFGGFPAANSPSATASTAAPAHDPRERVDALTDPIARIQAKGMHATGALETRRTTHVVVNTQGLRRAHSSSFANFRIWALESAGGRGASGFAQRVGRSLQDLDLDNATDEALESAIRSKAPRALGPGHYDVVLAPDAVAELFEWMSFIAFGAETVHQGTSPLADRFGEPVSGPQLTVREEPASPLSFATPFDREGTLRERVELIECGVARGFVTDRRWAPRFGRQSTGHAPWPSLLDSGAPEPSALVVAPGKDTDAELLSRVKRGLYIRRLHYVNGLLETRRAVMTGLSRDGTFWVENGKLQHAVHPLRFTDSILEAFARDAALGKELSIIPPRWSDGASVATPAVFLPALHFTGVSSAS